MDHSDQFVSLGRVVCARGNKGEVSLESWTGGQDRFEALDRVILFDSGGESLGEFRIESCWEHRGRPILKFFGVDSISDAERLAGAEVRVPLSERRELPDGEYYHSDLIGCEVLDASSGEPLGKVVGFKETGGPGLLEVEGDLLIPFARGICVELDVKGRKIRAALPEGLKDLNRR